MAKKIATSHLRQRRTGSSVDWSDRSTAVVTGASSGIGREFALLLAGQGHDVVLVARDAKRLGSIARGIKELHGVRTLVVPIDLGRPGSAEELYDRCARHAIVPDVLINNAGFALYGALCESALSQNLAMLRVNVMTPFVLTRLFLPAMIARGRGSVLNIASTAGFQPGPKMANYYATKSYVIALTVALAEEVRDSGITVSVLCPGPTRTAFHDRAGIQHTQMASLAFTSPRLVAEAGLQGLVKKKTIIVPGTLNKISAVGVRLLPLSLAAKIVQRLHR